jgi:hypothetical protein
MRVLVTLMIVAMASGCESPTDVRTAAYARALSGSGQQGVVNALLPEPFVLQVLDARLRPVAGVQVTWTVTYSGSGTQGYGPELLDPQIAVTDQDGRVSVRAYLGPQRGDYKYWPLFRVNDEWAGLNVPPSDVSTSVVFGAWAIDS